MTRRYVVVLRGPSTAAVRPGDPTVGMDLAGATRNARVTYDTYYQDRGFASPVPAGMWLEVRGELADDVSFADAIGTLANAGLGIVPLIAVAANTDIGEPEVHLALDVTPGEREHVFFQSFVPETFTTRLRQGRRIDAASTVALGKAIDGHPRSDRLRRAIVQYREALRYWKPGQETLAVAHIWMAVEALTKMALEQERFTTGAASDDALASAWCIEKRQLDSAVRVRTIFHGEDAVAGKTNRASNGWEHSFMDLQAVRELAREVRDAAADHVRRSIIELSGVGPEYAQTLLSPPYDQPLPTMPLTTYLWGRFNGDPDNLAPPGESYPIIEWTNTLTAFTVNEAGTYDATFETKLKVRCGEGVTFDGDRLEAWGVSSDHSPAEVQTETENSS